MIQDKGSNYSFYNHTEAAHVGMSVFDLSALNTLTIPNGGQVIPLAWYETLPKDKWEIDFQALLRVMPQVVPLYSRQRIFVHAYWSRIAELWNEAETYYTKGYTGTEELKKPCISEDNFDKELWDSGNGTVTAESLADYLDLPQGAKYSDLAEHNVSALPFMMYERIYQEYYMNRNFYTENRQWLPNDDGDFRLNTAGKIISVVNNPQEDGSEIRFGKIHVRDWTQDYFTSALPWPQRGAAMTINSTLGNTLGIKYLDNDNNEVLIREDGISVTMASNGIKGTDNIGDSRAYKMTSTLGADQNATWTKIKTSETSSTTAPYTLNLMPLNNNQWKNVATKISGANYTPVANAAGSGNAITQEQISMARWPMMTTEGAINLGITANDLRNLMLNQKELETMARTDGSYAQFGLAFFGEVSKSAKTYKPRYIGGTYQNIEFQEVLQNSQSTEDSPLGAFAGRGGMTTGGNLGTCQCDDFGILMIVASIVPDTYYSQGLPRKWTRATQEDEYLPDRAKLGMQAILNEELVYTGNLEKDKDVWAWQNRFDELRYMENKIHGKVADRNAESFYPYTQARQFTGDTPGYSQEFAKMDDVRKDYLVSETESAYIMQCAIQARVVRPLPYKAVPATMI